MTAVNAGAGAPESSELHQLLSSRRGWLEVAAVPSIRRLGADGSTGYDIVLRLDGTYLHPLTDPGPDVMGWSATDCVEHWMQQLNEALVLDGLDPIVTAVLPDGRHLGQAVMHAAGDKA